MKGEVRDQADWDLLVGYSLEEAEQVLQEEEVDYRLQFTAPWGKRPDPEAARVIAVQNKEKLVLICATADWTVS
ncbi:MAG: hypothetical protein GX335_06005 [Firmicutes bacterium]|nr:hypothetical protein [Bacillota bacterium]